MRDDHPIPGADHLVDGVRLHVAAHGNGPGLPVLMLHGVPTSSYLWRDVQRDLESRHRTFAVDLLGLGCSERPADQERYGLAEQARVMTLLLDEMGLDRVAVVGHDVGGGVALHLAALAPERVAALVLVDTPAHADTWPVPSVSTLRAPVLGDLQALLLRAAPGAGRAYLRNQLGRGVVVAEIAGKRLEEYAAPLLGRDGGRGLLSLVRALDPPSVEAALRMVAAEPPPTLVLWGDRDVWLSAAYGRRLAESIPGARWVPVADAGHLLPDDRPERVAEEVEAFLAEVAT